MPNVYSTKTVAGSGGLFTVEIIGASTLLTTLRRLSPEVEQGLKREISEAGRAVLGDAKGLAFIRKAPTGDYSRSLSMRSLARGVKIQSNDPGAGAIEFANAGAVYLRGPLAGQPIGTPAVGKPKALIKAANDHEPAVIATVQDAIQRACDTVRGA